MHFTAVLSTQMFYIGVLQNNKNKKGNIMTYNIYKKTFKC